MKQSRLGDFLYKRFLIINLITLTVTELFKLANSYWVSCSLCFSRNWFILPKLSNLCVRSCSLYSLIIPLMSARSIVTSFLFLILEIFLFFSVSLAVGFSILLIFQKHQLFVLLIFSTFFCFLFHWFLFFRYNVLLSACFGFLLFFFSQVR